MRYKMKVTFVAGGRVYEPGAILPADISAADLAFLREKNFVEPAELTSVADGYNGIYMGDEVISYPGLDISEPDTLKSPEEIMKMRSKKDVAAYADSIGCDLGEDYEGKSMRELQEEVINFQEEELEEEA